MLAETMSTRRSSLVAVSEGAEVLDGAGREQPKRGATRVRLGLVERVARGIDAVLELVVSGQLDEVRELEDAADSVE